MKSLIFKTSIIGIILVLFSSFFVNPVSAEIQTIEKVNITELTQQEIDGLLLMREEEKLAHEVYANLYKKWDLQVFDNISQSELRHTSAIKMLLDEFGIQDPYVEGIGNYSNKNLSELYIKLIEKGNKSLDDALEVGAKIEDLDINDLNKLIENTKNDRLLLVYGNLNRGSKKHLRAFTRQLAMRSQSYTPQFISQEEYNLILASNFGKGNNRGRKGNNMRNGNCQNNDMMCNNNGRRGKNNKGRGMGNGSNGNNGNMGNGNCNNNGKRGNGMRNGNNQNQGNCVGNNQGRGAGNNNNCGNKRGNW